MFDFQVAFRVHILEKDTKLHKSQKIESSKSRKRKPVNSYPWKIDRNQHKHSFNDGQSIKIIVLGRRVQLKEQEFCQTQHNSTQVGYAVVVDICMALWQL